MLPKPTFVFVPRTWHSPDSFDAFRACLAQDGYPLVDCRLLSISAFQPVYSMKLDVVYVRDVVAALPAEVYM